MRGIFRGNIVVSNLPEAFGDEDLAALFDPYGLVLGARRLAVKASLPVQSSVIGARTS